VHFILQLFATNKTMANAPFFFLIDAVCYNAYVMWKITSTKPNKRVDNLTDAVCFLLQQANNSFALSSKGVPIYRRSHISLRFIVPRYLLGCSQCSANRRHRSQESAVDVLAVPEKKTSRLKTDAVNASNLFAKNTRQKNSYVRDAC